MIRLAEQGGAVQCTRIRGRQFDASPIRNAGTLRSRRVHVARSTALVNREMKSLGATEREGSRRAGPGQAPYQRGCGAVELV